MHGFSIFHLSFHANFGFGIKIIDWSFSCVSLYLRYSCIAYAQAFCRTSAQHSLHDKLFVASIISTIFWSSNDRVNLKYSLRFVKCCLYGLFSAQSITLKWKLFSAVIRRHEYGAKQSGINIVSYVCKLTNISVENFNSPTEIFVSLQIQPTNDCQCNFWLFA